MSSDNAVATREVACRTILNRSSLGNYSLNCYTGCTHACAYCYARSLEHYRPHEEAWGSFLDVKINAIEVLMRQLRYASPGQVFLSSACDGWQPAEKQYRLTRRCCQLLLERGFSLHVLTKSDLVLRDFDIFAGQPVTLGITITSAEESLARLWEPGAAAVARRWQVLLQAHQAGLNTTLMLSPLLPSISDGPGEIQELLEQAVAHHADSIFIDSLNPRRLVWPSVAQLLRQHFPGLRQAYHGILFDRAARSHYLQDLRERIQIIARVKRLCDRLQICFGSE